MKVKMIECPKRFSFISQCFALISNNQWNMGKDLRAKVKEARRKYQSSVVAFEDTYNMPCGYQDYAADKMEEAGRQYMILVHSYLSCRYGGLTGRLSRLVEDTLIDENVPRGTLSWENV